MCVGGVFSFTLVRFTTPPGFGHSVFAFVAPWAVGLWPLDLAFGVWSVPLDVGSLVFGLWSLVFGLWSRVLGLWPTDDFGLSPLILAFTRSSEKWQCIYYSGALLSTTHYFTTKPQKE